MNSAALATPPQMIIQSDLIGEIEISPDELIDFPGGLFGFPDCRSFVLLPAARDGLFWLQSAEHGALAFLLIDPFRAFTGYTIDLGPADRADLCVTNQEDVVVLAIVTLPRSREQMPTANLQGPLALNLAARRGKQLAVADTQFGVRREVDLDAI